jgi:hypothetical protein
MEKKRNRETEHTDRLGGREMERSKRNKENIEINLTCESKM